MKGSRQRRRTDRRNGTQPLTCSLENKERLQTVGPDEGIGIEPPEVLEEGRNRRDEG